MAINVTRVSENSMIEKTDEKTSLEILSRNRAGRLGCVLASGGPYVVPVNYLFADGYCYVHSMPGLRMSAMEANTRACLQTDRVSSDGFSWKSVIALVSSKLYRKRQRPIEFSTFSLENFQDSRWLKQGLTQRKKTGNQSFFG